MTLVKSFIKHFKRWLMISKQIAQNPLGDWGPSDSPNVRVKGIRDYAILRLLWDNALRRNEICSLNVGDFHPCGRLAILGKGKLQKIQIDLSAASTTAIARKRTAQMEIEIIIARLVLRRGSTISPPLLVIVVNPL